MQLVRSAEHRPEVILLQEPSMGQDLTVLGYQAVASRGDTGRGIAILVAKVFFLAYDIPQYKSGLKSQLVEIIRRRKCPACIFVLNIYTCPSNRQRDFGTLLGCDSESWG